MKKILFVNACVRPESRTNQLARCILEKLGEEIEEVRLSDEHIPPLDWKTLQARDAELRSGDGSGPLLRCARQFAAADDIMIAAPYWDLLFPAILRAYLEAVTVTGVTFRYTQEGAVVGLCQAKRLFYVTTAGGTIGNHNYGFEYVKALAQNLYGIQDVPCFTAEGLDIVGADTSAIMQTAMREAELRVESMAFPGK